MTSGPAAYRRGAAGRVDNGGFMRVKVVTLFSNVAELGRFFGAAAALCMGLVGLR